MSQLIEVLQDERVTARFVRFLIAEDVVAAPRGGRANADYGDDHVTAIRRYLQLRDLGLTAARTREVVTGTAAGGVPISLAPGLTLIVDREKLSAPPCPQTIAARVRDAIDLITEKDV